MTGGPIPFPELLPVGAILATVAAVRSTWSP